MMPMTWLKGREIFFIEAWHFGALILWFLINLQLRRRGEKSPLLKRYFQVQICLLIFIISKILKTISPVIELRWFFIVTQYAGITLLGPSFLFFAFIYTHHREFPAGGGESSIWFPRASSSPSPSTPSTIGSTSPSIFTETPSVPFSTT